MKVMILSDSHSMAISDLIHLMKCNNVDYYIHCGDIFMFDEKINMNNLYLVKGNNDFKNLPNELFITIDNLKFLVVHGHHFDVDYNLDHLIRYGKDKGANVICYGHTHTCFCKEIDNMLVINPGSVSYPRGMYRKPTYCILDTVSKEVTFYNANNYEVCDPFEYERKLESELKEKIEEETKTKKEPFYKRWFKL